MTISFRLTERQGVSDFALIWSLRDLRAEGLRLESDFTQPEKWKVAKQGPFTTGFGNEQPPGKGGFHIPLIVMTAAQAGEFKGRHGEPNSPERIAEWVRFSLDAQRAGLCEGVVTYALDKSTNNPYFDAVRKESLRFGKPRD
ncbi:MAG: hypothetical protein EXS35_09240 [Pedosphaera sp.]|nr:hypothetical protein [Pedosphaera sp.]